MLIPFYILVMHYHLFIVLWWWNSIRTIPRSGVRHSFVHCWLCTTVFCHSCLYRVMEIIVLFLFFGWCLFCCVGTLVFHYSRSTLRCWWCHSFRNYSLTAFLCLMKWCYRYCFCWWYLTSPWSHSHYSFRADLPDVQWYHLWWPTFFVQSHLLHHILRWWSTNWWYLLECCAMLPGRYLHLFILLITHSDADLLRWCHSVDGILMLVLRYDVLLEDDVSDDDTCSSLDELPFVTILVDAC